MVDMRKKVDVPQQKREEIVRKSSLAVMEFLLGQGYEIGFSFEMLERCIRDSFATKNDLDERDRLFSVLDAMKSSSSKTGVESRAVILAKKLVPALPNRDVWLVTQTDDGGIRFENTIARIDVSAKRK